MKCWPTKIHNIKFRTRSAAWVSVFVKNNSHFRHDTYQALELGMKSGRSVGGLSNDLKVQILSLY